MLTEAHPANHCRPASCRSDPIQVVAAIQRCRVWYIANGSSIAIRNPLSLPRKPVPRATPEEHLLLRVLRGESAPWPDNSDAAFQHRFLDACNAEGLTALVHHRLRSTPAWNDWPAAVRGLLVHAATMQSALDMLQERELIAVLTAFAEAGIGALLLKGAALAYSHYPEPALRTRCDADVLIRTADLPAARHLLEGFGYRRPNAVTGTLVSYQECHAKREGPVDHVIDLHWQINNGQVFAHALRFEESYARSVPVPQLAASARALCPSQALLLACMHRAAHLGVDGPEGNRLIWLYDIHLIANAMTAGEWRDFEKLCVAKAMRWISLDALACTQQAFATAFPDEVIESLAHAGPREISAAYLDTNRLELLVTDLRALRSWGSRAVLLRELLFPPAKYLFAKYPTRSQWLLPWWYVRRVADGMRKTPRS